MKNIFKLMGMALIAGSLMFVACNKDEEEENNNNNNGGNNGGTTTTAIAKVTFGSSTWDAAVAECYSGNLEEYGIEQFMLFKTADELPFVNMMVAAAPGTYQVSATLGTQNPDTDSSYTYYAWPQNMDIYSLHYFEQGYVPVGSSYYGDWQPVSASLEIKAFDANTLKTSFDVTATMYDFYSWYYMMVNDADDADTKDLTIAVNNYTFTEMED